MACELCAAVCVTNVPSANKYHCTRSQWIIVILFPWLVYLTELCTAVHCQIVAKLVKMIVLMLTNTWSLEAQMSNIIRSYIDHMKLAVYMAFLFIIFLHVLLVLFYHFVFCVLLFSYVSYVFLLLCFLIVMNVLFRIFCFHCANWHSSATLNEVFLCFFHSCKANAMV